MKQGSGVRGQGSGGTTAGAWRGFLEDWGTFRAMQEEFEGMPVVQAWREQQAAAGRRREKKRWRRPGGG